MFDRAGIAKVNFIVQPVRSTTTLNEFTLNGEVDHIHVIKIDQTIMVCPEEAKLDARGFRAGSICMNLDGLNPGIMRATWIAGIVVPLGEQKLSGPLREVGHDAGIVATNFRPSLLERI